MNAAVSKTMKGNKKEDTKPELIIRRRLREAGYTGYRLHWKNAPGHPDICFPGRKIAIFINGCFWHSCPRCNIPIPSHNNAYWMQKLEHNKKRDLEELNQLNSEGWTTIVLWECDIKGDDGQATTQQVIKLLEKNHPERFYSNLPLNNMLPDIYGETDVGVYYGARTAD